MARCSAAFCWEISPFGNHLSAKQTNKQKRNKQLKTSNSSSSSNSNNKKQCTFHLKISNKRPRTHMSWLWRQVQWRLFLVAQRVFWFSGESEIQRQTEGHWRRSMGAFLFCVAVWNYGGKVGVREMFPVGSGQYSSVHCGDCELRKFIIVYVHIYLL